MEYKVLVTSYYTERKIPEGPNFDSLRAVEDILNQKLSKKVKAELVGVKLKEKHTPSPDERIVCAIVCQKDK